MSSITVLNKSPQPLPQPADNKLGKGEAAKLKSLANDFESVLIGQMLKTMRESIPEGGLVKNGYGEKVYRSVLDQEFAKMMSGGDGDDLAKALFEQLKADMDKEDKASSLPVMKKGFRADIDVGDNRYFDKGIIK